MQDHTADRKNSDKQILFSCVVYIAKICCNIQYNHMIQMLNRYISHYISHLPYTQLYDLETLKSQRNDVQPTGNCSTAQLLQVALLSHISSHHPGGLLENDQSSIADSAGQLRHPFTFSRGSHGLPMANHMPCGQKSSKESWCCQPHDMVDFDRMIQLPNKLVNHLLIATS